MHKTIRTNVLLVLLSFASVLPADTWTPLKNRAPGVARAFALLTDGTVMVDLDGQHWSRLTPDRQGNYANGDWTTTPGSSMSIARFSFTTQVLPNGKLWVFGGEYSGVGMIANLNGTGEIFDPVSNTWSPVPPLLQSGTCWASSQFGANITKDSAILADIVSTSGWQPGWTVTGSGIPAGSVIVSVDSPTQVHISSNATSTGGFALTLGVAAFGNTTQGSNVISGVVSTSGYQTGWPITGKGIPAGAVLSRVLSATSIQISQNATATATGVALALVVNFPQQACFGDDPTMLLQGGKILAGYIFSPKTYLYDIATNTWGPGPNKVYGDQSDEEGWVKLADGRVLTYDRIPGRTSAVGTPFAGTNGYAEIYDPVANKWSGITPADGSAKGVLPFLGDDMGPAIRLFDDRVFVVGANGHTALYTPSTNSWAVGPDLIDNLGGQPYLFTADDAPAASLPNGHVIFAADAGTSIVSSGSTTTGSPLVTGIPSTAQFQPGWNVVGSGIPVGAAIKSIVSPTQVTLTANATGTGTNTQLTFGRVYSPPTRLFDFNPSTNTVSSIAGPASFDPLNTQASGSFRMLALPTGQVLFANVVSSQLWIYTPDGAPDPVLLPTVSAVSAKGGGVFTLSGTQLTGQSAGSSFGDEFNSDSNYPIVSFTDVSGNVFYARTTNWSYVGVAGGALPQTVDLTLPPQMPPGVYALRVSGAGLVSRPYQVTVGSDLLTISPPTTLKPVVAGVQDAESARTSITSGQWVAIYGQSLSYTTRVWNNADFMGGVKPGAPLPTALDGIGVTIGGKPAAVFYVSPTQIDVLSPSNLPSGPAQVVVTNNGAVSASFAVTVVASSPSFFNYGAGGKVFPAAVHLSGKLVGDPSISGSVVEVAHPGEVILMYGNGLEPSIGDVLVAASPFTGSVTITAGDYPIAVLGAALVSAGQFQINVQLPANIPAGNYPLTLILPDGSTSTSGVTVTLPVGP